MKTNPLIQYSVAPCSLGHLLLAATGNGVCAVSLSDQGDKNPAQALEARLRRQFPSPDLQRDDIGLQEWMEMLLQHLDGRQFELNLPLDVQGTPFQQRVWQALRDIPYGETRTYTQIAHALAQPGAVRAVGGACAANSVALVIPCHRVVREGGTIHGFRWGSERKRILLQREAEYSGKRLGLFAESLNNAA